MQKGQKFTLFDGFKFDFERRELLMSDVTDWKIDKRTWVQQLLLEHLTIYYILLIVAHIADNYLQEEESISKAALPDIHGRLSRFTKLIRNHICPRS